MVSLKYTCHIFESLATDAPLDDFSFPSFRMPPSTDSLGLSSSSQPRDDWLEIGPCMTTSGWWFYIFSMFIPLFGEDEPILTSIFFRWVGSTTKQMKMCICEHESCLFT